VSAGDDARDSAIYIEHNEHGQKKAAHRREYHIRGVHIVGALFDITVGRTWETAEQRRARYGTGHQPHRDNHQSSQSLASASTAIYQWLSYGQIP